MATGGLGVIQMDFDGKLVKSVAMAAGIISGQTAVCMEMAALLVALHFTRDFACVEIVSDCNTVVLGHKKIPELADSYKCIHAGVWRLVRDISAEKMLEVTVTKVKAHRNQADVAEADLNDWQSNEYADQWAKLGSTDRHEKDADAAAELLALNLRKARRVVMWLAN